MSLNNLKTRITFQGGNMQVDRMIKDKKKSLEDALWRSYQSATIALSNGKEFRCLINPNKFNMELDDKILSIPYQAKCLNTSEEEEIDVNIQVGDVVIWKHPQGDSPWLVYSQYLQETAYFRGQMRQCESSPLEINGQKFYYYLKGPSEKSIDWQKTKHLIFNDLNYTSEIYISNTKETKEFFQRFKKLKICERVFEVQAIDDLTVKGILIAYLKEEYANPWVLLEDTSNENPALPDGYVYIEGPSEIYPYDTASYKVLNTSSGKWVLSNNRARIIEQTDTTIKIEVLTGRSGDVSLIYRTGQNNDVVKNIKILSL